jgi:hypothetical protein
MKLTTKEARLLGNITAAIRGISEQIEELRPAGGFNDAIEIPPKKMVTKEIQGSEPAILDMCGYTRIHLSVNTPIPNNAKNVRILYDIEE